MRLVRRSLLVPMALALYGEGHTMLHLYHAHLAHRTLWLEGVETPFFALAVLCLAASGLNRRGAIILVLGVGVWLQVIAVMHKPLSSDDDFRYAWDAKVQLSGTDPYRYAPSAPELVHLRNTFDFPTAQPCENYVLPDGSCSTINRPTGRTIYPPVAQVAFDAIRILSFGGRGGHLPLQIAAGLGAIAMGLVLARRGLPAWRVALWSWCPITVVELGNNAHIDWLGALLAVLGLLAYADRHERRAGFLVGAAAMVKLYPALVGAAMLRRRPVATVVAAASVVVVSYLPHVLAVGKDVIGYLPSYLQDEQYLNGQRFLVFHDLFTNPDTTQHLVVALLVVATALIVLRTDPDRPEFGALAMVLVATTLTTPGQGWYSVLLLALIALTGQVGALPLAFVPTLVYLVDGDFGVNLSRDARLYRWAVALTVLGLTGHWAVRRSRRTRSA